MSFLCHVFSYIILIITYIFSAVGTVKWYILKLMATWLGKRNVQLYCVVFWLMGLDACITENALKMFKVNL
jgi:hypothetical protein